MSGEALTNARNSAEVLSDLTEICRCVMSSRAVSLSLDWSDPDDVPEPGPGQARRLLNHTNQT